MSLLFVRRSPEEPRTFRRATANRGPTRQTEQDLLEPLERSRPHHGAPPPDPKDQADISPHPRCLPSARESASRRRRRSEKTRRRCYDRASGGLAPAPPQVRSDSFASRTPRAMSWLDADPGVLDRSLGFGHRTVFLAPFEFCVVE